MAPTLKIPNIDAQRAAMKKLEFLVGEWSGEASPITAPKAGKTPRPCSTRLRILWRMGIN